MVVVPTDKVKSGQILAEEVRDVNGRLLLSKGIPIEANHIRVFKIWGVTEVRLASAGRDVDGSNSEISLEVLDKKKRSLQAIFRHLDPEHPAVREIFRIALLFRSDNNIHTRIGASRAGTCRQAVGQPEPPSDLFRKLHRQHIVLPEIPSVAFELNEVISNPVSSADHIARVVSKSPSLTAILLRIVNSSMYGLPSKISTVSHAVSIIGTREISGLALGISIISVFKSIPQQTVDMHSFLKHSLACGILSRAIAAHKNMPQTELLFVAGLLHDLGRLMLYIYFPEESRTVLRHAQIRGSLLYKSEQRMLGCDHAAVGSRLMKQWNLPSILEDIVVGHHSPSKSRQLPAAGIVHLADIFINALGIGSSGEEFVPPLDNHAWQCLELSPNSFEIIVGQALHQFRGLESILNA